jgi:hypothetical protein
MAIRRVTPIAVQQLALISSPPFGEVVSAIENAIGHPDMREFSSRVAAAKTLPELEQVVNGAIGPSGFMEFMRINHGQFLDKAQGEGSTRILRFIVGNPLIMMQIAIHAPDAGSHSPVTILVDQRDDGVHLSYNTMAGYLAHYGNLALTVARELDTKVEALLKSAAG